MAAIPEKFLDLFQKKAFASLATLMPVFTLIAYLFIGETSGGKHLRDHASLVLVGTLVSWVPYMVTIIVMAPHYSAYKSIGAGMLVFFVCATAFLLLTQRFGWFR